MTNAYKHLRIQIPDFGYKRYLVVLFLFFFLPFNLFSQMKDTVYIKFDEQHEEMRKEDFTREMQAGSPDEILKRSIAYYIEQMEPPCGYDNEFNFAHVNRDEKIVS